MLYTAQISTVASNNGGFEPKLYLGDRLGSHTNGPTPAATTWGWGVKRESFPSQPKAPQWSSRLGRDAGRGWIVCALGSCFFFRSPGARGQRSICTKGGMRGREGEAGARESAGESPNLQALLCEISDTRYSAQDMKLKFTQCACCFSSGRMRGKSNACCTRTRHNVDACDLPQQHKRVINARDARVRASRAFITSRVSAPGARARKVRAPTKLSYATRSVRRAPEPATVAVLRQQKRAYKQPGRGRRAAWGEAFSKGVFFGVPGFAAFSEGVFFWRSWICGVFARRFLFRFAANSRSVFLGFLEFCRVQRTMFWGPPPPPPPFLCALLRPCLPASSKSNAWSSIVTRNFTPTESLITRMPYNP